MTRFGWNKTNLSIHRTVRCGCLVSKNNRLDTEQIDVRVRCELRFVFFHTGHKALSKSIYVRFILVKQKNCTGYFQYVWCKNRDEKNIALDNYQCCPVHMLKNNNFYTGHLAKNKLDCPVTAFSNACFARHRKNQKAWAELAVNQKFLGEVGRAHHLFILCL